MVSNAEFVNQSHEPDSAKHCEVIESIHPIARYVYWGVANQTQLNKQMLANLHAYIAAIGSNPTALPVSIYIAN